MLSIILIIHIWRQYPSSVYETAHGCIKMVNNYKRKSDRQSWLEEDMKNAIEKVLTHKMGVKKAATTYNIPKATLLRRLDIYEKTKDLNKAVEKKMGGYVQVFDVAQEKDLASYARLFDLTTEDLRRVAYDLAEKNKLQHNFCRETKMAGRKWLENFLKRNPDLNLRKLEPTSAARASGFNQIVFNQFLDLPESPTLNDQNISQTEDLASNNESFCIAPEDIIPIHKSKSSSEDPEDVRCVNCSQLFSESTEDKIPCCICLLWAHCSCAGVKDRDNGAFIICKRCNNKECLNCSRPLCMSTTRNWIQCDKCYLFSHYSCANIEEDDEDVDSYICKKCDNNNNFDWGHKIYV